MHTSLKVDSNPISLHKEQKSYPRTPIFAFLAAAIEQGVCMAMADKGDFGKLQGVAEILTAVDRI